MKSTSKISKKREPIKSKSYKAISASSVSRTLFNDDKTGNRTINPYALRFILTTTFQNVVPIVAKSVSEELSNLGDEEGKLRVLLSCRDHGKIISNLIRKRMAFQKVNTR
mmetsp:Transcript_32382/g.39405  ORF Transcript_32382/g.39405 Transcript_32382/m.39405 type:complete len:110 (+) Transcript_32382:22-351(+)